MMKIINELQKSEKIILLTIKEGKNRIDDLIKNTKLSVNELIGGINRLKSKGLINVELEPTQIYIKLSQFGEKYYKEGLPEKRIVEILKLGKISIKELPLEEREKSKAIGYLKKIRIIDVESGGIISLKDSADLELVDKLQNLINKARTGVLLNQLSDTEKEFFNERHRERGGKDVIFEVERKAIEKYTLSDIGKQIVNFISVEEIEEVSQLTPEMLKNGSWRNKVFREYNIDIPPKRIIIGRHHPYCAFLQSVREKLISMGFKEMIGELVESEFWNMDALYMPQFHSARDIHGIFYLKEPKYTDKLNKELLEKVAKIHENGGETGSFGWQYKFDKKEAGRLILRSQGTALSVRMLSLNPNPPGKYFAIARCFRPDQPDTTHSCEFFQIEGIVVSSEVNFKTLLGLLKLFANEIAGSDEVKFKPGYFPFTEPSVELHVKHKEIGWIELGGAGIFRPEVTAAFGVKVPVLAWGIGLDRMAMTKLNITDIRNLFSTELNFLRKIKL